MGKGLAGGVVGGERPPRRAAPRARPAVVTWAAFPCFLIAVACNTKERDECRALFATAQDLVSHVESDDADSVKKGVDAIDAAIAACNRAELTGEVQQLTKGKNKLDAHLQWLADRPEPRKPLTPAEIEALEKNGDPNCPKGQAYKYQGKSKEIRCTGPQPVDFAWKQAEAYYGERNYKVGPGKTPSTLTAEFGAQKMVYHFESEGSSRAAPCVLYFPPPNMSWQEATARISGVGPHRLRERDGKVKTARGQVPYKVEEDERKLVVMIGSCQGKL